MSDGFDNGGPVAVTTTTATTADSDRRTTRAIAVLAVILAILLIVLIILIVRELLSEDRYAYPPVAGIRAVFVIYGPGEGEHPLFDSPMGAAFGKDGRIYVADTGHNRIVVFDGNGNYLFQWGELGVAKPAPEGKFSWEPGRFNYPTDVAVDDDGLVYVADFRNDQIQVFDPDGRFVRVFPDRDAQVGKGASGQDGTGIAVTSLTVKDGRVYATDKYQVLVFDTEGKLLSQFGKPGNGPSDLDHPNGLAVSEPFGEVVVSDSNHGRVLSFGPNGKLLWSFGGSTAPMSGEETQAIEVPRGLSSAGDGSLLVADGLGSRLVRISSRGETMELFGQRGDQPGELNFPMDVAAEADRLLIADKGNHRVQVVVLEED